MIAWTSRHMEDMLRMLHTSLDWTERGRLERQRVNPGPPTTSRRDHVQTTTTTVSVDLLPVHVVPLPVDLIVLRGFYTGSSRM